MSKKEKAKKPPKKKATLEARYNWDNGEYARDQTFRFILPWQFLFMCKLTDVTPDTVINQFMNDLGHENWKRRENDAVRQTFKELDAIGSLWPGNAGMKLIDRHAKWRNKYHDYWFKKWYRKLRRKP